MMKILIALPLFALCAACASSTQENVNTAAAKAVTDTRDGLADAAMAPLEDLNLRRDEIHSSLVDLETPYVAPEDLDCVEIARRIGTLNGVLGLDWDEAEEDERLRSEKIADGAASAALGAVASEARGMIPFRGVIRKATGAADHAKKHENALRIGAQQRAYLKGVGLAKGCPAPARPDIELADVPAAEDVIISSDEITVPAPGTTPEVTTSSPPSAPTVESEGLESVPLG